VIVGIFKQEAKPCNVQFGIDITSNYQ